MPSQDFPDITSPTLLKASMQLLQAQTTQAAGIHGGENAAKPETLSCLEILHWGIGFERQNTWWLGNLVSLNRPYIYIYVSKYRRFVKISIWFELYHRDKILKNIRGVHRWCWSPPAYKWCLIESNNRNNIDKLHYRKSELHKHQSWLVLTKQVWHHALDCEACFVGCTWLYHSYSFKSNIHNVATNFQEREFAVPNKYRQVNMDRIQARWK